MKPPLVYYGGKTVLAEKIAALLPPHGHYVELYDELYGGWHRVEIKAWSGNGIRGGRSKTDGDRTEVLWSNRPLGDDGLFKLEGSCGQ